MDMAGIFKHTDSSKLIVHAELMARPGSKPHLAHPGVMSAFRTSVSMRWMRKAAQNNCY
jgi:hypothetical protein